MKQKQEMIRKIKLALEDMGWSIAIPETGPVDHLIVGEKQTVEEISGVIGEEDSVMSPPGEEGGTH